MAVALNGCSTSANVPMNHITATTAAFPRLVERQEPIENTLTCIRKSGLLRGRLFAVGPFVDSTGKINSVAAGATGNFLPQAGSASYVTDTLKRAGAEVLVQYFGAPEERVRAEYVINGIFNTLDFGSPVTADLRVAGVGPIMERGWAQLTLTIQMDVAATRINRQISMIQRPVRYSQAGVGVGTTVGAELVTGSLAFSDQQRLQFEAVNGPVALGVIDVLIKEFPVLEPCRHYVAQASDDSVWATATRRS
jgi:hypothetical protein